MLSESTGGPFRMKAHAISAAKKIISGMVKTVSTSVMPIRARMCPIQTAYAHLSALRFIPADARKATTGGEKDAAALRRNPLWEMSAPDRWSATRIITK